ncbi:MAG: methyltransferase domain-containing protein [Planctomycetes bacterium]|nr:methyltransferase domain-containing protein [Planctomycetota bacterium]
MANEAQQENWNGPGGQNWVRYQRAIDQAIGVFGEAGLNALSPAEGEHIIDVGCGAGTMSMELARRVGPPGKVLGLDFSLPLLTLARERCAPHANVTLLHGDAGEPRSDRDFDALFSRFGVMFFEDPARSFANLRETLGPDGRLAFITWQARERNPWVLEPTKCMLPFLPEPPVPPAPNSPGPFGLGDPDFAREQLEQAGFQGVEFQSVEAPMIFSTEGVAAAVDFEMNIGPAARLAKDLDESSIRGMREAYARLFEQNCQGQTVTLPAAAWLVTARR